MLFAPNFLSLSKAANCSLLGIVINLKSPALRMYDSNALCLKKGLLKKMDIFQFDDEFNKQVLNLAAI